MKFNCKVSSNPSKARKALYTAPASQRAILMSARLSKELREKYNVIAIPIHKDDEVKIIKGHQKVAGKVTAVRRSKYVINIDKLTKTKANGQTVPVAIRPSNVIITKLFLNKDREAYLAKKAESRKSYKDLVAKRNEEVAKVFKAAYPDLTMDIFGKKVEPITEKKPIRIPSKKMAEKLMSKPTLRAYKTGIKVHKAKNAIAAYKAALAKKIAK
ncbi:ribosomal protein L24, putative [Entamoeba histolytica HM-1:IMSS-B]|uniref:60S ribosomal protein L26, putative n=6 Tax=Entamoeba histolytica TaxID=5759 RepID=C4M569_ENTH1|nr:60S ribosomal protein L26, putative [Entamoeba histolytica HM-1:IMSS]EMD49048.1 60S ribosomal protein L26 [Entamoeba histolytica KU27]EMH74953.1 ribosomal protein L24, putative [Entamoeba histolytica HM-1:IMSS-B]EMS12048.1 60S ribosomal protein L26, putative [Entamoeba histolytica HM-3:IMSS]ENY64975.1 60S ribosomal protein L26, putative [Entamoeba histolytica HM-1:IMSS-A]BAN37825.1 60S ribosomal protein L26, putative [Entamoeba histolytica]|eukprot:XP_649063.1 60S ribosomal protein L26, putative [Entamoeba histolytica HM-1:IMSS]